MFIGGGYLYHLTIGFIIMR